MSIEIANVTKIYDAGSSDPVRALENVTTTVQPRQLVTLLGPSGCGKTTLLDIVAGLTEQTSGEVRMPGALNADASARPGIVFQNPVLLPWRTVLANVLLPAELGGSSAPIRRLRKDIESQARDLLALVNLEKFADKLPHQLSGGMQQRVAIARALLLHRQVLLMDEPFSALDEFTREHMNLELLRIREERGLTVLFVTHNVFEAVFLSDRVLVMTPRPGAIVADITIDLPKNRNPDLIGSESFGMEVKRVRNALDAYWKATA